MPAHRFFRRQKMSVPDYTVSLPHGYTATFSYQLHATDKVRVQWEPATPVIRSPKHRRKFFEAYAHERRKFWQQVASEMGGAVLIVDTNGEFEVVLPSRH
jgi:hypothetical protein